MTLRCRFHCKNAGFEDLTTGILHFLVPRIPWEFWCCVGFDGFFSRLYILLCILSSNAFGVFGLGKCKLVILRSKFHCKNAGFGDLTTGVLHFWFLGFAGNSMILRCRFHCKNAGFEDLTTGSYIFWLLLIINLHVPRPKCPKAFMERMRERMYNLEFRGKPFFDVLWGLNVAEWLQTYADIWLKYIEMNHVCLQCFIDFIVF